MRMNIWEEHSPVKMRLGIYLSVRRQWGIWQEAANGLGKERRIIFKSFSFSSSSLRMYKRSSQPHAKRNSSLDTIWAWKWNNCAWRCWWRPTLWMHLKANYRIKKSANVMKAKDVELTRWRNNAIKAGVWIRVFCERRSRDMRNHLLYLYYIMLFFSFSFFVLQKTFTCI